MRPDRPRVLTTNEAGILLRGAGRDSLAPLLQALRLGVPVALGRRLARELLTDVARAEVAEGPGTVRALVVEWNGRGDLRQEGARICRALASTAPTMHWMVVARDRSRRALLIAAPPAAGRGTTQALLVDTGQVRASDAETLAALAAAATEEGLLLHTRWREILGRDGLTRRFYRDFEQCVATLAETAHGTADAADRRTVALLHASRLLFLAFLEAKGLLDGDRSFLRHAFTARCGGRGAHARFLAPLFFGTLNTPPSQRAPAAREFGAIPFLNGGLFTRTPVERRTRGLSFTDDALSALVGDLLGRYRITARETSDDWAEAAVDPEMLGRTFESLMASGARRDGGVFYTPQPLIARLTRQAIDRSLGAPAEVGAARAALERLRILDPACGSGAFLVFALEELAVRCAAAGDHREVAAIRRGLLARSIFGVDRDPVAVWLCQLRLWLSVIVEDETVDAARLPPLPNLDRNIREGDALSGDDFDGTCVRAPGTLEPLRVRYTRASGARKRALGRALEQEERRLAIAEVEARRLRLRAERMDLLAALRSRDLFQQRGAPGASDRARLRELREAARAAQRDRKRLQEGGALPFAFATHLPSLARDRGVELVIGNPPWVRLHRIPARDRASLRARFECFREAAWVAGASASGAGRGFGSQVDVAALFVERAVRLTRAGGVVALLVPAKLWGALAGGGLRAFLAREAPVEVVETWSGDDGGFDAAVYPSALVARRVPSGAITARAARARVACARHHAQGIDTWSLPRSTLAVDASPGAPWLVIPGAVRRAFDRIGAAGVPMAESPLGRPILGVKTGCNAAFVLSGESLGAVTRRLLRPVIRGEDLRPFAAGAEDARAWILWTHDHHGAPMRALPEPERRWLLRWRRTLERRTDARHAVWWSLFRTEAARSDLPRVVWADIGRRPRASVLPLGDPTVPLNSCYVARVPRDEDAHALAALLNAPLGAAWLRALAEPARGGYRRFLGWTCARFPVPADWERARGPLAELGRAATQGDAPDDAVLLAVACRAYGVRVADVAALIDWEADAP